VDRDSIRNNFFVLENSDSLIPRDLLTHVLNYGRLKAHQDIADHDSKRQDFFALANPDSSMLDFFGSPNMHPQLWTA
jgi:hypothetical protein